MSGRRPPRREIRLGKLTRRLTASARPQSSEGPNRPDGAPAAAVLLRFPALAPPPPSPLDQAREVMQRFDGTAATVFPTVNGLMAVLRQLGHYDGDRRIVVVLSLALCLVLSAVENEVANGAIAHTLRQLSPMLSAEIGQALPDLDGLVPVVTSRRRGAGKVRP